MGSNLFLMWPGSVGLGLLFALTGNDAPLIPLLMVGLGMSLTLAVCFLASHQENRTQGEPCK